MKVGTCTVAPRGIAGHGRIDDAAERVVGHQRALALLHGSACRQKRQVTIVGGAGVGSIGGGPEDTRTPLGGGSTGGNNGGGEEGGCLSKAIATAGPRRHRLRTTARGRSARTCARLQPGPLGLASPPAGCAMVRPLPASDGQALASQRATQERAAASTRQAAAPAQVQPTKMEYRADKGCCTRIHGSP